MKLGLLGAEAQVALTACLIQAIRSRQHIVIGYKDEIRLIQPHALGRVGKLRAFQLYPEPGWRMFDLAKFQDPTFEPAPLYARDDKDLKPGGILAQV